MAFSKNALYMLFLFTSISNRTWYSNCWCSES